MKKEKCRLYQSNPTLQQANFWWSSKPTSGGCVKNAKVPLGDKGMSPVNLRKKQQLRSVTYYWKGMDESLISLISIYCFQRFCTWISYFGFWVVLLSWVEQIWSLARKHQARKKHLLAKFLLMEEILHQLIGRLCLYLQGFIHPTWLGMGLQPSTVSLWSWVLRSLWRYWNTTPRSSACQAGEFLAWDVKTWSWQQSAGWSMMLRPNSLHHNTQY